MRKWADLFWACGQRGMFPPVVKACTMPELAAFLGTDIDRIAEAEARDGGLGGVPSGRDVIAERLAHARGEGPAPEAEPVNPALTAALGALVPPEMNDANPRR